MEACVRYIVNHWTNLINVVKATQTKIHSKQQDYKVIIKLLAVLITVCQWLSHLLGADLITIYWQRIIQVELKAEMEHKAKDTVSIKAKQVYIFQL